MTMMVRKRFKPTGPSDAGETCTELSSSVCGRARSLSMRARSCLICRRRYPRPPKAIQSVVASHVKVTHQMSTACTHNHFDPDDSTKDEMPALTIELFATLLGE